jgi:hypothetical protein
MLHIYSRIIAVTVCVILLAASALAAAWRSGWSF